MLSRIFLLLLAAVVPTGVGAQATTPPSAVEAPASDGPVRTLSEVLARAREEGGSPNLVVLREQVVQAEANLRRAWAMLLPTVTISGAITRNSHEAAFTFPTFGFAETTDNDGNPITVITPPPEEPEAQVLQPLVAKSLMAQATMPLVVMPAYFGIANARQAVEAAERGIEFAEDELLLGIAQAYYGAVATKRIVEVAELQLETAIAQEKLAKAMFDVGEQTRVGPLRAGVVRAGAEQELRRAHASHELAKLALVQLAGLEGPFTVEAPPSPAPPEASLEELVRAGLEGRGDLDSNRSAAEIADRAVTGAWWQFAPVIAANAQWLKSNSAGFTGEDTTWAATLTAMLTVYDGGNRYATLKEARSRSRAAAAELEAGRRQVVTDVRGALIQLDTARGNALTAGEQAKLAEETALLVEAQYQAGQATSLDLADATTQRFAAQVMAIAEELNVDLAVLRLRRAIGRLDLERLASGEP